MTVPAQNPAQNQVASGVVPRGMAVRAMEARDWADVRRIYALGIATRNATFGTEVPTSEALDVKWVPTQRWVIVDGAASRGRVVGWAAMTPTSARACYRGVAETSIYIDTAVAGRGFFPEFHSSVLVQWEPLG